MAFMAVKVRNTVKIWYNKASTSTHKHKNTCDDKLEVNDFPKIFMCGKIETGQCTPPILDIIL